MKLLKRKKIIANKIAGLLAAPIISAEIDLINSMDAKNIPSIPTSIPTSYLKSIEAKRLH